MINGTDHGSHAEQNAAIHAYLRWHNRNAQPAKPWRIKAEVHGTVHAIRPPVPGYSATLVGGRGAADARAWFSP